MDDDNSENHIDLISADEAKTSQAVASLVATARQLRELSDFLADLAKKPIEPREPPANQ